MRKTDFSTDFISRFIDKIIINDGCWNWGGAVDTKGYGVAYINHKKRLAAHRVSSAIFKNEIRDDLLCCHHCDNPRCVKPSHLFTGTQSDNMADASAKGRISKNHQGELNPMCRLKVEDVVLIRKLYETGKWSHKELAFEFNIDRGHMGRIVSRRAWKFLN